MTVKTPSSAWTHRWRLPSALALVAVVTLAVYWGALANGFNQFVVSFRACPGLAVLLDSGVPHTVFSNRKRGGVG